MHNSDLIAQEDTIYVVPEHRNGIGRKFTKVILAELKERGVKRLNVSAMTDLRATKLWKRLGFKELATQMTYTF
jgi:ribosomal protein S18 acetylase RimI-like enzyme